MVVIILGPEVAEPVRHSEGGCGPAEAVVGDRGGGARSRAEAGGPFSSRSSGRGGGG